MTNPSVQLLAVGCLFLWGIAVAQQPSSASGSGAATPSPSTTTAAWTYESSADWKLTFPDCGGQRQSPINVVLKDAVPSPDLGGFALSDGCAIFSGDSYTVENTGHSFVVTIQSAFALDSMACKLSLGWSPAATATAGETYSLSQVHFHRTSEHQYDGLYFTMAAHCVFRGSKDPTKVVVLAVPLTNDIGLVPNASPPEYEGSFVSQVLSNLPDDSIGSKNTTRFNGLRPLSFRGGLISSAFDGSFFTYSGSFTTPPCTEGVTWVVLRQATYITRDVMLNFVTAMLKNDKFFDRHGGNVRPVQPLNGRVVKSYSKAGNCPTTAPSGGSPSSPPPVAPVVVGAPPAEEKGGAPVLTIILIVVVVVAFSGGLIFLVRTGQMSKVQEQLQKGADKAGKSISEGTEKLRKKMSKTKEDAQVSYNDKKGGGREMA